MAYWRFVSGNDRQRFAGAAGPPVAVYTPAENAMQQAAIGRYFDERNAQPARFVWPLRPARGLLDMLVHGRRRNCQLAG